MNFTVQVNNSGKLAGMVSFMDIDCENRSIQIGNVWYGLEMQGSGANTEVTYLLLKHAFEDLGF